jgi:protein-disulfide isomerase
MTTTPPPGWYPDTDPSRERWWDGQNWGEALRAAPGTPEAPPASGAPGGSPAPRRPIWPWVLGGSVLVVIAVAVAAVLILTSVFSSLERSSSVSPGGSDRQTGSSEAPADAVGDGIVLGDGGDDAIRVVTYIDYFCPFCGQFESTNAEQLSEWVESGEVVLEVHPVSILDRASLGTQYSTRAANAAACVADTAPDRFEAFSALLFENQPAENTEGLSDADLVDLADQAGALEGTGVADCIDAGQFTDWVTQATDRALSGPLPESDVEKLAGTPTVIVDGSQYTGSLTDAQEFADFVMAGSI